MLKLSNIGRSKRYKEFSKNYDVQDPVVRDVLIDYCCVCELLNSERTAIMNEGTMVDGLHGKIQNPRIGNLHKFMAQKKAALAMLKQASDRAPAADDALDELLSDSN